MKHIITLFCLFITLHGFAQEIDSLKKDVRTLHDSLTAARADTTRIRIYKNLNVNYDALGKSYLTAYSDSARQSLDSVYALSDKQLKQKAKEKEETAATGKNSFYFRLFTDFVGFQGDQPNGLAQFDLAFRWKLNNKRYRLLPIACHPQENKSQLRYERSALKQRMHLATGLSKAQKKDSLRMVCKEFNAPVPRRIGFAENIIFPIIELSKIKDSLRYKDLDYDSTNHIRHIHTMDLVKYSNFSVSGKLNVVSYHSVNNNIRVYIDVFGTLYSTGVYENDTNLLVKDRNHNVNSVGLGGAIKFIFAPAQSNFQLEASYQNFELRLLNPDIYQRKTVLHYPEYDPRNATFNNGTTRDALSVYVASLRYSSTVNTKNKNSDGVFLRVAFYNHSVKTNMRGVKQAHLFQFCENAFVQVGLHIE